MIWGNGKSTPVSMAKHEVVGDGGGGRLERDIASAAKVSGISRGWLDREVPHTSPIVWYGGSQFPFDHIFDEILRKDTDLAGFELRARMAILALGREIVPRDATDGAQEAVEVCKEQVRLLGPEGKNSDLFGGDRWGQFLYATLGSIWRGTSFVEANWDTDTMFIDELIERPMRNFGFIDKDGNMELRLRRINELVKIPPGKIIFSRNSMDYWPWGDPLATYAYWVWLAKLYNELDYAYWLEKWAKPIPDIEYKTTPEPGTTGEIKSPNEENDAREAKLVQDAKKIHGNGYFVHNEEVVLKMLGTNVTGGEQYFQRYTSLAAMLARLLLNETSTSGFKQHGGYNEILVSRDIGADRQKFFVPGMSAVVESSVFNWLTQIHTPGAPVPVLRVDSLTAESYNRALAGIEAALETIGVPKGQLKSVWDIRELEPKEQLVFIAKEKPKVNSPEELEDELERDASVGKEI